MKNNAVFHIKYDGPALAGHEMDVKDLAPALLAFGELFEEANRILNKNATTVSVNLKATETGCVDVVLSVTQDILTQAMNLFNSDGVNATLNAKEILTIMFGVGAGTPVSYKGVIGLLKWIKNREIESITTLENGDYTLKLKDHEATVVKKTELELFKALKIRKSVETIIANPLRREGIDTVSFISGSSTDVEVTKDENEYFVAPPVTEEIIDEIELSQSLQIVNISFQDGGKWRFSDGNATFYADILDKDFMDKVTQNQAAFAKDDILMVTMKRKQSVVSGGLRTEYTIVKVNEHKSAVINIKLPFA